MFRYAQQSFELNYCGDYIKDIDVDRYIARMGGGGGG
jgi:hypothetical protein